MNLACVCTLTKDDWDAIYKVASIILGTSTLILAVTAYRKFLQNKLRDKQLDIVCELITQIQNDFQHLLYCSNKKDAVGSIKPDLSDYATLFDVPNKNEFSEEKNLYFFTENYPLKEVKVQSWDFFLKYYSHPLVPKNIAIALNRFNVWNASTIPFDDIKDDKFVVIGLQEAVSGASCYYTAHGIRNCKEFKEATQSLRQSILDWAKKYKVADLNIATSHVNQTSK